MAKKTTLTSIYDRNNTVNVIIRDDNTISKYQHNRIINELPNGCNEGGFELLCNGRYYFQTFLPEENDVSEVTTEYRVDQYDSVYDEDGHYYCDWNNLTYKEKKIVLQNDLSVR